MAARRPARWRDANGNRLRTILEIYGVRMLYNKGQEPIAGYCHVEERRRPIDKCTIRNFGCYETEADDEDREKFGPGQLRLECGGCGATCEPIFKKVRNRRRS